MIAGLGIAYIFYDDSKRAKEWGGSSLEWKTKHEIIRHVAPDYGGLSTLGLSFKEDYKIKELMSVQDSSKTYKPTPEDWKRAYKKLFNNSLEK